MSNLQLVLIYFYVGVPGAIRKSGLWYFEDLVAALTNNRLLTILPPRDYLHITRFIPTTLVYYSI